ncbi:MAG: S9 family peptidase [Gammaproteobacteria bacterium]|nr:S9 family peptidase [Gammaproteobacteria bacterium]
MNRTVHTATRRTAGAFAAVLLAALWISIAHATLAPSYKSGGQSISLAPQLPRPAVPLEAFFADPEFEHPQLSPDGRKLAVLHRNGTTGHNLKVIDLQTNKARTLTSYSRHNVTWFVWIDEFRIAYRAEPTDDDQELSSEWFNLVDFSTSRTFIQRHGTPRGYSAKRHAEDQARWRSLRLLDPRPIGAGHLLVTLASANGDRAAAPDVAAINVYSGAIRVLARNPGDVYHWVVDRDGTVRIAVSLDRDLRTRIHHRRDVGQPWEPIYDFSYDEAGIWPIAFADDPNVIYVLSNVGRDTRALFSYDLRSGELGEQLFAHDQVDVSGLVLSRDGKSVIGARYETDRQHIYYFDAFRQAIDNELAAALAGYEIDVQFSEDGQTALVTAHNERNPGRFYHFDAHTGRLRELFSARGFLPEHYLSPTHAIDFRARDGERIHGFLTVPRGSAGAAPMIVVVHGGPHEVRDRWGFDPEIQFLANRGYSVLQVNFRGSAGYGRRFEQLGWGSWGEGVQDDIADAVNWTAEQGYSDPQRVCIYGWSFGGYSALMNMVRNPGLYRCGVSFGGVTDLSQLVAQQSPVEMARQTFLDLVVGSDSDPVTLALSSPINRIDDIQAPVLVAHGLQDDVVPVSHFQRFVQALAIYDKPGEGLLMENQGHGLADEQARFLFYRRLEQFLEQHLAPVQPHPARDEELAQAKPASPRT